MASIMAARKREPSKRDCDGAVGYGKAVFPPNASF
jgi:hypothetical protein